MTCTRISKCYNKYLSPFVKRTTILSLGSDVVVLFCGEFAQIFPKNNFIYLLCSPLYCLASSGNKLF